MFLVTDRKCRGMEIITFAIGGSGSGFCLKFFCKEICSSFLSKFILQRFLLKKKKEDK